MLRRTSGNLCLSFSSRCTDLSENPSIQPPQVTLVNAKHHHGYKHKAVLLGTIGGSLCALLVIVLAVFIHKRGKGDEVTSSSSIICSLQLSYYKLVLLLVTNKLTALYVQGL